MQGLCSPHHGQRHDALGILAPCPRFCLQHKEGPATVLYSHCGRDLHINRITADVLAVWLLLLLLQCGQDVSYEPVRAEEVFKGVQGYYWSRLPHKGDPDR